MSYCTDCNVLLNPELTQCPYCDSGELVPDPPPPSQGNWVNLPNIPGIVEANKVSPELTKKDIHHYIDQSGTGTNIKVGTEKYDQGKQIQFEVLGY